MSDRDRLVEQISNATDKFKKMWTEWVMNESHDYIPFAEFVADYLLANGVIVAPMPMADWLKKELTEYVYQRCMEEL